MKKFTILIISAVFLLSAETLFQVKDSSDRVVLDVSTDGLRVYNEGDLLMEISSSDIRAFIDNDPTKGLARSFSVTTSSSSKGETNVLEISKDATQMREGDDGQQYTDFSPANIFLGLNAGKSTSPSGLTNGQFNIFLGNNAGFSNNNGYRNVFIGDEAGRNNFNNSTSVFIGYQSGYSNRGDANLFVGNYSGKYNDTGYHNTYIGHGTGFSQTVGDHNTYIGLMTGHDKTGGSANTLLGSYAGRLNQSGDGNVFLGYAAGYFETGSDMLYIANTGTTTPLIKGTFPNTDLELRATDINLIGKVYATALGSGSGTNLHITSGNEIVRQTSSRKYKKDIEELFFDISEFMKLRPVSFKWNEKSSTENKEDYGLIAEEVEKIDPQLAIYDGVGDIEGVDYQKINIMLLKVVQEQEKRIDELEKVVATILNK